jgi:epsilon-lactone hydrolase
MSKLIAIVGYGPGTSASLAERFAKEGFSVALVGRDEQRLAAGVAALRARGTTASGFSANAGDPESIRGAIRNIRSQMGPIDVLQWNVYGGLDAGDLLAAEPPSVRAAFDATVVGLLAATAEALPDLKQNRGALLISNGAFGVVADEMDDVAVKQHVMGIAVTSAAKNKLAGLLAHRLRSEGVYVGEVMVFGTIKNTPSGDSSSIDPAQIAEEYWRIYQARNQTRAEVKHASQSGRSKSPANITLRPLTDADAKARTGLRSILAPRKGVRSDLASSRAAFDALMRQTPAAQSVEYASETIGGIPGVWCRPPAPAGRTVLYLHGGWFVSGSADAYRNFVGHIAARSNAAAFIPGYRLAPEHPFPAAVEDAQSAYRGLIERGLRDIVVAGDSAGGALALELMARLVRDAREPRPTAAVLLSPVSDLSLSGVTWESRDAADLLFTKQQVRELVDLYLHGADLAAPFSSLTQDFAGFPPLRMHVGDDEVLLDDSLRVAQRAADAGIDVRLDVWEGMLHVFPSAFAMFEAANAALDEIGTFIHTVSGNRPTATPSYESEAPGRSAS